MKLFVIRLKKNFISFCFLLFTICLVVFSSSNLSAAKSGLKLWANSVIPSLFPFFVATELLSKTNIPRLLGKIFNVFMKPLFNISGEGSFAFIMGILSGYPVGSKIAVNFRQNNILTKSECERLLSFTNNSGPLFIIGTVGISMYGDSSLGILFLITHILASITVGIIFRFWKKDSYDFTVTKTKSSYKKDISFSNLGEVLAQSISSSTSTIIMIGGFIVLFSVIISIFKSINLLGQNSLSPLFIGLLEITNGISSLSNYNFENFTLNIVLTSFLLGFGGISILLQVLSITSKSDLSIKPYILGKILHGLLASFYTYLILCF